MLISLPQKTKSYERPFIIFYLSPAKLKQRGKTVMILKKQMINMLVMSLLLPLSFAFAKDYSEAIKVNEKFISAMDQYVTQLESAQSSSEVASAFNLYSDTIEKLVPEMQALKAKYPELANMESPPAELQPITERMEQLGGRMAGAMMKIIPFMNEPEVQAAQERMAEIMSQLQ